MPLRDTLRVLVVDDMSTSRGILLQALDTLGIGHVAYAADGAAGLRSAQAWRPDLVLSDLYMPGLDGLGLLRSLRANPDTRDVGFILVTGRADETVTRAGRAAGSNGVLAKPFGIPELQDCIESVVGHL